MNDSAIGRRTYRGPAFFSYGFRPFFFGAALFAGVAVPAWILMLIRAGDSALFHTGRLWHVHEMIFGFLPAVVTGFLLTAIPNWTDRPPVRGGELILLSSVWLVGRLVIAVPWFSPIVTAIVDGAFLVAVAGLVWREIAAAGSWSRAPIGVLIGLYAAANVLFHVFALTGAETEPAERTALGLIMMLLALIGGMMTPNFTREYLAEQREAREPAGFSGLDGLSIVLVATAAVAWILAPEAMATGWMLLVAGLANLGRLSRWRGWMTWHEPLVLILHVGYGWLAISLLLLGSAILRVALQPADAVHALTTGAVGAMTLAVMTRASLSHAGRIRHAGPMTIVIYTLANVGALLRAFGPLYGLAGTGRPWAGCRLLERRVFAVCHRLWSLPPTSESR